jgi:hypothetical protein
MTTSLIKSHKIGINRKRGKMRAKWAGSHRIACLSLIRPQSLGKREKNKKKQLSGVSFRLGSWRPLMPTLPKSNFYFYFFLSSFLFFVSF